MLLNEIRHIYAKPVEKGTEYGIDSSRYVGVHFTPETKAKIRAIIDDEDIPNGITDVDKYHSTVAYSKGSGFPDYNVSGTLAEPEEGVIDSFDVFPSKDGNNCLVAKLSCPFLHQKHQETLQAGANYDYEEYKPHITLSYDVGEVSQERLKELSDKYAGTRVFINDEYDSPLEDDWASKNT